MNHPRCNTATFGNADEELKVDEIEKLDQQKYLQTEAISSNSNVDLNAAGGALRTTTVVKRGQMVNSKRQMMLLMNGDITYSCSKQGLNMFFNQKTTYKNRISLEDLIEVQMGKGNSLTFITTNKGKYVRYTFGFESMQEAYSWE